jgi:hypothetical protein
MPDYIAARGPLKYPSVLFDSSQIDQAGTSLKLCTSSLLNDESSFMLCSLANTWVEVPTLNTSETQRLYCFSTFPFRLGTNGPISEELETQRVSVMGLRPCPRVSSDNQPLAVRYRMTHIDSPMSIVPTLAQESISIPFPMTQYLFLI